MDTDFTENSEIDEFSIGDSTINIIGYVSKVNNNLYSSSESKFQKFTVNNNQGREVQVIAWNKLIEAVKNVTQIGQIVLVGPLKAVAVKFSSYNSRNVPYELLVQENTQVDIIGTFKNLETNVPKEINDMADAVSLIVQHIKLQAAIKTEFSTYKAQDFEVVVGSVTDCYYRLEIKVTFPIEQILPKLLQGFTVEVTGKLEKTKEDLVVLKVEKPEHLVFIEKERIAFLDILQGYRNLTV